MALVHCEIAVRCVWCTAVADILHIVMQGCSRIVESWRIERDEVSISQFCQIVAVPALQTSLRCKVVAVLPGVVAVVFGGLGWLRSRIVDVGAVTDIAFSADIDGPCIPARGFDPTVAAYIAAGDIAVH